MHKLIITVLCTIIMLSCAVAYAANNWVYLVVMSSTSTSNSYFQYVYHEVVSMNVCYDIIKNSRVDIPHGGDGESSVVMYCTAEKGKILTYKEMNE